MYNICMAESILQRSDVKGSLPRMSVYNCVRAIGEMGRRASVAGKSKTILCVFLQAQ